MTHKTHKSYLLFTAILIGGFGPIFALGAMESASEPARWTLDLLSWPLDGAQTYDDPTTRFLTALTGGFLFGWGVMVWCLRQWVYDLAPEGVRKSLVVSAIAWCVLDSFGSIMSGNAINAFFNIIFLLLAIGPMWRPAID